MRIRRWVFDRGDNLAGAIYGIILVTSLVAAADGQDEIWRSLGIVEATVVVFWLAHVYADALGRSGDSGEKLTFAGVRRIAGRQWPLLQAAIVPSLALLAGCLDLIATRAAYLIAIGYGVAALVWWGFLFARKEQLGRGATIAVVVVNLSFGLHRGAEGARQPLAPRDSP